MTTTSAALAIAIEHYWEHGWVVIPDVYTRAETTAIAELAEELAWREYQTSDQHTPLVVDTADGITEPRKLDWAFPKHPAFRTFVLDHRLTGLVAALLGQPGYLLRDQVFLKPARVGSVKPWHQDQPHLHCDPADQVIAAWIALDDATLDNGCLRYIDASHHGPLLDHHPMPGAAHNAILAPEQARAHVDWNRRVPAPAAAGSVVLHHPLTLHSSRPNRSPHPRRAYSTHWAAKTVTCTDHTLEWAYSTTLGAGRHRFSAP
ncbi:MULTISPECIES: phytanoyl-CoA dioxygenase family protein [Nocardia]|uniref:phytanoyl-CoA dioxygenase family protein n=1 Tax=Nocardia TaxID=1817 RepID=UPI0002EB9A38|nr:MULTISPECIES: phytanoyl-CoA dioxygenase family protein [Nocardia]